MGKRVFISFHYQDAIDLRVNVARIKLLSTKEYGSKNVYANYLARDKCFLACQMDFHAKNIIGFLHEIYYNMGVRGH